MMADANSDHLRRWKLTSRDFTYVDNAVNAQICWLVLRPTRWRAGRVFNIGTGKSETLNDDLCRNREDPWIFTEKPIYAAARAKATFKHSLASIDRARKELGL